jgi:hypothetical protein
MTRFGIHRLVAHYAKLASKSTASLCLKRVSPHTIRHYAGFRTIPGEASLGPIGGGLMNIFPA